MSEGDSTHSQIVGAQFYLDTVARHDSDIVHPHLSANVGENFHIPFVQLHAEPRVRQVFDNCAIQLNALLLIRLVVCFGFIVPSSSHVFLVYQRSLLTSKTSVP